MEQEILKSLCEIANKDRIYLDHIKQIKHNLSQINKDELLLFWDECGKIGTNNSITNSKDTFMGNLFAKYPDCCNALSDCMYACSDIAQYFNDNNCSDIQISNGDLPVLGAKLFRNLCQLIIPDFDLILESKVL